MVGARYLQLDETLAYNTTGAGGDVAYDIAVENRLVGVQIGLLTQFLLRPRMWIDADLKGGIFANEARLNQALSQGAPVSTGSDTRNRTSFVGELNLQFNYSFTNAATFYAGYNAYWITGVALAQDNFQRDFSLLSLGPAQVDHRGETVYHGPNIGVTVAW